MIRPENQAELLDILVSPNKIGLNQKTTSKLIEILDLQFQKETLSEVYGVTFIEKEGTFYQLGLEVVKPQSMIDVENAIKLFREGDYSKVKTLADYANTACRSIEKVMKLPSLFKATKTLFDFAAKNTEKLALLEKNEREKWVCSYLEILGSYVSYPIDEIQIPQDFLGFFHCHSEGSEPSPIDLKSTIQTGIPEIVISANEDYKSSGAAIYLCFKGDFRKLYQGPLQPTKKE